MLFTKKEQLKPHTQLSDCHFINEWPGFYCLFTLSLIHSLSLLYLALSFPRPFIQLLLQTLWEANRNSVTFHLKALSCIFVV